MPVRPHSSCRLSQSVFDEAAAQTLCLVQNAAEQNTSSFDCKSLEHLTRASRLHAGPLHCMSSALQGHHSHLQPDVKSIDKSLQHYYACKAAPPAHTSALIALPGWSHDFSWQKHTRRLILVHHVPKLTSTTDDFDVPPIGLAADAPLPHQAQFLKEYADVFAAIPPGCLLIAAFIIPSILVMLLLSLARCIA